MTVESWNEGDHDLVDRWGNVLTLDGELSGFRVIPTTGGRWRLESTSIDGPPARYLDTLTEAVAAVNDREGTR